MSEVRCKGEYTERYRVQTMNLSIVRIPAFSKACYYNIDKLIIDDFQR
jgi:hypothetical protein